MWSLIPINEAEGGPRFRLLVGKKYTLGRQSADFTITNDKSISRIHATLEVTHPETNVSHPHKPPVFTVRDSSKFGTVVRDEKIVNAEQLVKNGDRVKFGTVNSIYSAVYEPYVVTTSCLDQVNKRQTKTLITQLGGHVVSDWRKECQLLIMTSLSVTVKVICALVSLRPIVTVQYLQDLTECIGAGRTLPNPEDYTPPLAESQLNPNEVSFKRDERRQTLFKGKTFVFLNPKQFKKLNVAVELAGGKPVLMEEGTDDNKDDILVKPTTCVMHADPNDTTNNLSQNAHEWVKHVVKVLRKRGLRAIPDCELGFAVLYCSTERYCNPSLDSLPSQAANLPSQSLSQQVAPPSQSQPATQHTPAPSGNRTPARTDRAGPSTPKVPVKVKEEPVSQAGAEKTAAATTTKNKKRLRSEDDDDANAAKIPRIKDEAPSPIPPRRSARRSPSPVPISPARSRRADSPESSSHSASPSPPPPTTARGAKAKGAGLVPKRSTLPAPRRSARSRSPSPAPQPRSPVGRRGRAAINSSRSPSPAPSPVVSPKSEPVSDELDDFDAFEPRSRRRRRSPAPAAVETKIERPSPARDQGKTQSEASTKTSTATGQKNDPKRNKRKAEDDVKPVVEKKPRRIAQDSPVRERVPQVNHDLSDDEQRKPRTELILGSGFLTTRKPIKDQVEAVPGNIVDHDVPTDAGAVIATKDLTVPRRPRPTVIAENNNIVNGKAVKNFKKFKKVAGAGDVGLPRIIGGTDLRPHVNDDRKVDAWFEEERQEQEKEMAAEKAADDMFSWAPSKTKPKTTRRR